MVESAEINIINPDGSRKTAKVYRFIIDDFDSLKEKINQYIVDLIYGDSERGFDAARNSMKVFVSSKSDSQKLGIVSELLMHLAANHLGTIRYNIIKNLEGNSMKKGFDGVYVRDSELWFGESKSSGIINTTHITNIDDCMECFSDKINGVNANNPWENALNHINILKNRSLFDESLKKQIEQLSDNFNLEVYCDSRDFNVIPSSTLIVNDNQTFFEVCEDCKRHLSRYSYRKLIIVCINNNLYKNTLDYLEMKNE